MCQKNFPNKNFKQKSLKSPNHGKIAEFTMKSLFLKFIRKKYNVPNGWLSLELLLELL